MKLDPTELKVELDKTLMALGRLSVKNLDLESRLNDQAITITGVEQLLRDYMYALVSCKSTLLVCRKFVFGEMEAQISKIQENNSDKRDISEIRGEYERVIGEVSSLLDKLDYISDR